jgi:hypothetical protein
VAWLWASWARLYFSFPQKEGFESLVKDFAVVLRLRSSLRPKKNFYSGSNKSPIYIIILLYNASNLTHNIVPDLPRGAQAFWGSEISKCAKEFFPYTLSLSGKLARALFPFPSTDWRPSATLFQPPNSLAIQGVELSSIASISYFVPKRVFLEVNFGDSGFGN